MGTSPSSHLSTSICTLLPGPSPSQPGHPHLPPPPTSTQATAQMKAVCRSSSPALSPGARLALADGVLGFIHHQIIRAGRDCLAKSGALGSPPLLPGDAGEAGAAAAGCAWGWVVEGECRPRVPGQGRGGTRGWCMIPPICSQAPERSDSEEVASLSSSVRKLLIHHFAASEVLLGVW